MVTHRVLPIVAQITVGGNLAATTDANNGVINLGTLAVDGTVALATNGTGSATIDNGTTAINIAESSVGGNLRLISGNASGITDSGTVTVGGNLIARTDANNGAINLGTLAVDGTVALATNGIGNATVVNDTALKLRHGSAVGGNLSATAITGDITDSTYLNITGTSSFTTSANNAKITLDNSNNAFTGSISLNTIGPLAHAVVDNGTTALDIAASNIGGDLSLISGNALGITDSGTVMVGGNLVVTTDANNGAIDLGTLAIDGTVAVVTNGKGNATMINDIDFDFANSTIGGDLTATATSGDLLFQGSVNTIGDVDLKATDGSILNNNVSTVAGNIKGETITLIALNTIGTIKKGINIDAKILNASTTSKNPKSDINILSRGNLTLAKVKTVDGNINIKSDGFVKSEDVVAGGVGLVKIVDLEAIRLAAAAIAAEEKKRLATAAAKKKKRLAAMAAAVDIPPPPAPTMQITPISMPSSRAGASTVAATPLIGVSKPAGGSSSASGGSSPTSGGMSSGGVAKGRWWFRWCC